MSSRYVLIVEDEQDIRELVSYNMLKEGYQVAAVASGEEAIQAVKSRRPDVVLLDLMLPGIDGLTVCATLKENSETNTIPVIMLTAKGEESDIVTGLNMGADDYVTKPFSPKVLLARVSAVLRRMNSPELEEEEEGEGTISRHELTIDLRRHQVFIDDAPVELTSTEFRVLVFLARRPGWVYTRQQILDGVHGDKYAITDRAVDVQIVGLRKKLGTAGRYIETVRGVGYRFKERVEVA